MFWLLAGALGLAGALLGWWALFADRAHGRRRCPKCWYMLCGTDSLTCSECGYVAPREKKLLKTRRRRRWAFVAALVVLAAYGLAVTPRIKRSWYGWPGAVPTMVLLTLDPWLETDGALADELRSRVAGDEAWDWQQSWFAHISVTRYRRANAEERPSALEDLGLIGPEATSSVPVVLAALGDDEPEVRTQAAYALGLILAEPASTIPALIGLLGDDHAEVRQSAAWALWKMGREADAAVPALTAALGDVSDQVRTQSAAALSRIEGTENVWSKERVGNTITTLTFARSVSAVVTIGYGLFVALLQVDIPWLNRLLV